MRLVLELEVPRGITVAAAVQAVARASNIESSQMRLRDTNLPCQDPRGGWTAFEWLHNNKECLYVDKNLWLQPKLRGG